jgi:hypothetical protein
MSDAKRIHDNMGGVADDKDDRLFNLPCNTNAKVALRFGGRDFQINPKDLTTFVAEAEGFCRSGIRAHNGEGWLVNVLSSGLFQMADIQAPGGQYILEVRVLLYEYRHEANISRRDKVIHTDDDLHTSVTC